MECRLFISIYGKDDELVDIDGPQATLLPGTAHIYEWQLPETGGAPIVQVGIALTSAETASGRVYLDSLTWDGEPRVTLTRPAHGGMMWQKAWTNGVDRAEWWAEPFRLIHDEGRGLFMHGTREWRDYEVSADVTPHMAAAAGIAARVQGMRRYYALLLCRWRQGETRQGPGWRASSWASPISTGGLERRTSSSWKCAAIECRRGSTTGSSLTSRIRSARSTRGAIALVCEEGRTATQTVRVNPA